MGKKRIIKQTEADLARESAAVLAKREQATTGMAPPRGRAPRRVPYSRHLQQHHDDGD